MSIRSHNVAYVIGLACYVGAVGISYQSIRLSQTFTYTQMSATSGASVSSWMLAIMYTAVESAIATPFLTPLLWEELAQAWIDFKDLPDVVKGIAQLGLSLITAVVVGIGLWAYYSDLVSVWGSLQLGQVSDVGYARGMTVAHVLGTEAFLLCGGISFWSAKRIEAKTANARAKQDYLINSARIRKEEALKQVRTVSTQVQPQQSVKDKKSKRGENNGRVDAVSSWGAM